MDSYGHYRRWFENLESARQQAQIDPTADTNHQEVWRRWAEATTEAWRRSAGMGVSTMKHAPQRMETAEGVQKRMLEGDPLTDPMDFFLRWHDATSGPISDTADDTVEDESFLEASRRFFEDYASFYKVSGRVSEEYFGRIQLPTRSDVARVAGLVVALEDKIDRIEEAFEDLEYGYSQPATAEDVGSLAERLERVESRLDQLDRVESKLDQLLAGGEAREEGGGATDDGARSEASS